MKLLKELTGPKPRPDGNFSHLPLILPGRPVPASDSAMPGPSGQLPIMLSVSGQVMQTERDDRG